MSHSPPFVSRSSGGMPHELGGKEAPNPSHVTLKPLETPRWRGLTARFPAIIICAFYHSFQRLSRGLYVATRFGGSYGSQGSAVTSGVETRGRGFPGRDGWIL